MGALPKSDSTKSGLAEVDEIDGRQIVRLPEGMRVKEARLFVVQHDTSIELNPEPRQHTSAEWDEWEAELRRYQRELGDIMPGGRNQGITKPKIIFPEERVEGLHWEDWATP